MTPLEPPPPTQLPAVVLTGMDRPTLEPVEAAATLSLAAPVLARFELDVAAGTVTRVLSDAGGILEREVTELDHTCLTCALRLEIVPTVVRLAELGRWEAVVVSLPVACQAGALLATLRGMLTRHSPVRLGATVAAVAPASFVDDVFGDDLLRERDAHAWAGDARAFGEVLVDSVEQADLVVFSRSADGSRRAAILAREIGRPGARIVDEPADLEPADLVRRCAPHDLPDPRRRTPAWRPESIGELLDCTRPDVARQGVWTVMVDTWRPFHPERLMAALESLGGHGYVGRGCFWLPTRPGSLAQWSGAGGQLSIGTLESGGPPNEHALRTRIVITGGDERREQVLRDLAAALLSERELAAGLTRWLGREDGFAPWLGQRSESA